MQTFDPAPLVAPIARAERREARAWLRSERQRLDEASRGLAVIVWVLTPVGILLALTGLAGGDAEMWIAGSCFVAGGIGVWCWRRARRVAALRPVVRLRRLAAAQRLAYAHVVRRGPKPGALLHAGGDPTGLDVLRDAHGSEWGLWRTRDLAQRGAVRMQGFIDLTVPADRDDIARGVRGELDASPFRFEMEHVREHGRLVAATRAWRVDDPAVQEVAHRCRAWIASQRSVVADVAPTPVRTDDVGRRGRAATTRALVLVIGVTVAIALAVALVRAWL